MFFKTTFGSPLVNATAIDIDAEDLLAAKPMANISDEQINNVDASVSLKILNNFLVGSVNSNLKASVVNKRSLTFNGEENPPFVYTSIHLRINKEGMVTEISPYTESIPVIYTGTTEAELERELIVYNDFDEIEF